MIENQNEIEIQATAEEVWDILTDFEKYADWNPLFYSAKGKAKVGERVRVSTRTASSEMDFDCAVVTVEPNRELAWRFHVFLAFLFRGEHSFRIEPVSERSIRFVDRESFEGLLVPFRAKYLETDVKAAMIEMGEALKERAETHGDAA
jgi:hypothetical protein